MNKYTAKRLLKSDEACAMASAVNAGLQIISLAMYFTACGLASNPATCGAASALMTASLAIGGASFITSHINFEAIDQLKHNKKLAKHNSSQQKSQQKEIVLA